MFKFPMGIHKLVLDQGYILKNALLFGREKIQLPRKWGGNSGGRGKKGGKKTRGKRKRKGEEKKEGNEKK